MFDCFGMDVHGCCGPCRYGSCIERRFSVEDDDGFHTKVVPSLLLQAFHTVVQGLNRGLIYRNDDADEFGHGQFSSRVTNSGRYRKDTGDSMDSGKLPMATNAISTS